MANSQRRPRSTADTVSCIEAICLAGFVLRLVRFSVGQVQLGRQGLVGHRGVGELRLERQSAMAVSSQSG